MHGDARVEEGPAEGKALAHGHVRLLDADPELGEALCTDERDAARAELVARRERLEAGDWTPDPALAAEGHVGLLVLDGVLLRRTAIGARRAVELLGAGDLLRPWDADDWLPPELVTSWHVVTPVSLAVLEPSFATGLGRYPSLAELVVRRSLRRSRRQAFQQLIASQPSVRERLRLLFWHLSQRWGRVRPDGVWLPLPLTHEVVAALVGARRPSVSGHLSLLAARGELRRVPGGYLLAHLPDGPGPWPVHAGGGAAG